MSKSKVNGNFRITYDRDYVSAAWSYDVCLYFRGQDVPGFGKNVLNVTKYTPTTSKHFKALRAELAVEGEGTSTPVEVDDLSKDASVDSLVEAANKVFLADELAGELTRTLKGERSTDRDWHRVTAGESTRFYVCPQGSTVAVVLDDVSPALACAIAKLVLKEGGAK